MSESGSVEVGMLKTSSKRERKHLLSGNSNNNNSNNGYISDSSDSLDEDDKISLNKKNEIYINPYIRGFFLVVLCLQNSFYTLLRRYAVGILTKTASSSSILIGGELIKLTVSIIMTCCFIPLSNYKTNHNNSINSNNINDNLTDNKNNSHLKLLISSSPKMFVPAFVYYCMNRLSFYSLSRIDAGTFVCIAQLKILMTAIFSYLILKKTFSTIRIRSLLYLVVSIIVISDYASTHQHDTTGIGAVGLEVTLSGIISVYYEKVLKDDKNLLSIWDRNIQLAIFSCILYFPSLHMDGYFANWNVVTFVICILGSSGGLLVAWSMKYTDAILKALATSGAIVLSTILGAMWLKGPFGISIVVSSFSVIISIITYISDGNLKFSFHKK